jgi:hypothetical protein
MINEIVNPRVARIIHIPYAMFWVLLWLYAWVDKNPPFTTVQPETLVNPETFPVIDWRGEFGLAATPLRRALTETFHDPEFSKITPSF